MFKKKIQCVTDQAIRKLMYIRAGKYACLPGDIEKKAVGAGISGGGCHVHLHNSPKHFSPVLNKCIVVSKHLLCAYPGRSERKGKRRSLYPRCSGDRCKMSFCKGKRTPKISKYTYSEGGLLKY